MHDRCEVRFSLNSVRPIGSLVTRGGEISFVPSRRVSGFRKAMEKMPDVLEKFMSRKDGEKAAAN